MLVPLSLALAFAANVPPSGWAEVESVRATGIERIADGDDRRFTVARLHNNFIVGCAREIQGHLGGLLRVEVGSERGIYTWLASSPRYALQLISSSAPEYAETLAPVRFNKTDLTSRKVAIQRKIGKRLEDRGSGTVCARPCIVVAFSDRTPLVQSLWVDEETGMALR